MYILSRISLFFHRCAGLFFRFLVCMRVKDRGSNLHVNGYCFLSKYTHLGNNVNLNGMHVLGSGHLYIGDNFHSGAGCLIITSNHNYDTGERIPYDDTVVVKDVHIADNVWMGARVIVLPGVTIEEGAIIQAGAVVVSHVSRCSIVGGNPAKHIKYRNIQHYDELKQRGMFF